MLPPYTSPDNATDLLAWCDNIVSAFNDSETYAKPPNLSDTGSRNWDTAVRDECISFYRYVQASEMAAAIEAVTRNKESHVLYWTEVAARIADFDTIFKSCEDSMGKITAVYKKNAENF